MIDQPQNLETGMEQLRLQVINQEGIILKEKNILYFRINETRIFKILILTKVDKKAVLRKSKFLLNIGNNMILNINNNKQLDDISYKSIISYGKLKSKNCRTIVNNIW